MDSSLEQRLRLDPTLDPGYVPGRFRDRAATRAGVRGRQRPTVLVRRPAGALLAVAVVIASGLVLRAVNQPAMPQPSATPSANPSSEPVPTMDIGRVEQLLDGWAARYGGTLPPISVTVIAPGPVQARWIRGLPEDRVSTVRIGEVSRLYLSVAVIIVDACTRLSQWTCPRPAVLGSELTLSDPVFWWYDPWPDGDPTTVAQLLEGSSGLAATATSITDLADRMDAEQATDWSRDAVIARAIAAPRAFAAGSQRTPSDTEGYVLEEVLETATGLSSSEIISTDGVPPFSTRFYDQAEPDGLIAGIRPDGNPLADLDPTVLAIVGNAGGMTSSSDDLAEYAAVWTRLEYGSREPLDYLVDASGGHANPIGARARCCRGGEVTTIMATGHASGWSALIAYDFELGLSVGVVAGRDLPEADLAALLDALTAASTGAIPD